MSSATPHQNPDCFISRDGSIKKGRSDFLIHPYPYNLIVSSNNYVVDGTFNPNRPSLFFYFWYRT